MLKFPRHRTASCETNPETRHERTNHLTPKSTDVSLARGSADGETRRRSVIS
jgi:hypothetical protein